LILGVSGCVILPFIRIFSTKKIIVNIDGVEWKRNKWHFFAKWFLKVSEKLAVKYSDCVVTDNKVIQSHVSRSYKAHSKLIEYGGDHVSKQELSSSILNKYPFLRKPYAFSVCRIEPENNICMILESFVTQRKLQIIIVGNWLNSSYGRQLFEKFHYKKGISLIDPIYDQTILNSIRANCDLYIHGHSAGGTNPSLVEAMHLELPIFAFGVNYNIETTEGKANYFSNSYELTDLVMDSNSDDLKRNACNMHEIASRRYVWSSISRKYASLF
jgi:glycosyltransferase involved in cell wall biosynthesis